MKNKIYLVVGVLLLCSCKKESSNTSTNSTNTATSSIAKYGNGVTDIEGNKYKTTIIGKQEWMVENLKVSKYSDGTNITNGTDNIVWNNNENGAWCHYDKDISNNLKYGKLYNWNVTNPTMNGNKNVCPTGWHVPSKEEWIILSDYLGGEDVAGGKMKEVGVENWKSPNTKAENTSLFTALAGGWRQSSDNFNEAKSRGFWWSSTKSSQYMGFSESLNAYSGKTFINDYPMDYGLSIRCLKD
jgi:uncharacterized protein (TIGR02145 family)